MSRIYTNDGVIIAKVMRDHLNTWENKPAEFKLEKLEDEAPCLMIQQMASAEKKKSYIDGSYIGVWNFTIYVRVNGEDTASRLDAFGVLDDLNAWFSKRDDKGSLVNLPEIDDDRSATKIEMLTTPSLAARYGDGTEDYQAVFSLEYKTRRKI